jgi:hypothetical protein
LLNYSGRLREEADPTVSGQPKRAWRKHGGFNAVGQLLSLQVEYGRLTMDNDIKFKRHAFIKKDFDDGNIL